MSHDGNAVRSSGDGILELGYHFIRQPARPDIIDLASQVFFGGFRSAVDNRCKRPSFTSAGEKDDGDAFKLLAGGFGVWKIDARNH